jgi:Ca2+-transporting ATPase
VQDRSASERVVETPCPWHGLPAPDVIARLSTHPEIGLSQGEVARRLARHGPNTLEVEERTRWYALLARQFADALIAILAVAAALSVVIGEVLDAFTILAILVFNALLGLAQEWRAERAIAALKRMLAPRCSVIRDGQRRSVDAAALVPGDIVVLETGASVPADLRLLETTELRVDESALTGESLPVGKHEHAVPAECPPAERHSIAWMGTAVASGRALGAVVATGLDTEFGRIATLTESIERERTPLQTRLGALGARLGALGLGLAALVAAAGWWGGKPAIEMFMTGVSLAVALVPGGLPAVVTITLALGIRTMARRRALLRRLEAAETLGSATVICTDKTGTLTQNAMTVRRVWLRAGELVVSGAGYEPEGEFQTEGRRLEPAERPDLLALLETGVRCNHARVVEEEGSWRAIPRRRRCWWRRARPGGEPTEEAQRLLELPFDSARKRMTIAWESGGTRSAHVKGAPEVILRRCTRILDGSGERELDSEDRAAAHEAYEGFAKLGLRTLALARVRLPADRPLDAETLETDLTLLGIVGILDPPRPEAPGAVSLARSAGIQVVMITGDAASTTLAIARRVGLEAHSAVTGADVDEFDDAALAAALESRCVFARTSPEHKCASSRFSRSNSTSSP